MGLQDNVKVLDVAEVVAAGMKGGTGALKKDGFAPAAAPTVTVAEPEPALAAEDVPTDAEPAT